MYIKKFESFNNIDDICKEYGIENYTINDDGSIDVDGNVDLSIKNLTKLPLKFGKVGGDFYCQYNKLTNLEGCPKEVGGYFDCSHNQLMSLEGCPKEVSGDFDCYHNKLTSLEGCPKEVIGDFDCSYNYLISLEGSPDRIGGGFYCQYNPIYNIYKLFNDHSNIELFNDYDIIRDNDQSIVLDRLNSFLEDIGKPTVNSVEGYNNI